MTKSISAERILKHLSYSDLKVSHFTEPYKGVFVLNYSLPYKGEMDSNCTYQDVKYFIEYNSSGIIFKKDSSSKYVNGQRGSDTIPGWEFSILWYSVKSDLDDSTQKIQHRIASKIQELGYNWANEKIHSL